MVDSWFVSKETGDIIKESKEVYAVYIRVW
jgi:hypothetical protein